MPGQACHTVEKQSIWRMALKVGLVGLPNVGKSTLFRALSRRADVAAENFPFCTIHPNEAMVPFLDERLPALAEVAHAQRTVSEGITFMDIAGLIEGAHLGKGLGNAFLNDIREVDVIIQVVRCFDDAHILHVCESVDPVRDLRIIEQELLLADMAFLDFRFIITFVWRWGKQETGHVQGTP